MITVQHSVSEQYETTTSQRRIHMEYLTDEHYAIAEANGIPKKLVDYRYYYSYNKWTIERAITEPVKCTRQFQSEWDEMKDIASSNGISRQHFGQRMRRGQSKEEAAGPKLTESERLERAKQNIHKRNQYLTRAVENGIKPYTYYRRLALKWTPEKACTEPVGGRQRVSHS